MGRPPVAGPVVNPGVVEAKLLFSDVDGSWTIVCHGVKGSTTVDSTLADSLATGIGSSVTSSGWATFMKAGSSFDGVEVKDLSTAYNPSFISSVAGVPAAGTGGPLGDNTALCVTKETAKAGREFRGRLYLGGLDGACTTDGKSMTGPAKTAAGNFGEGIRLAMTSSGVPMCISQRALQAGTDSKGNPLPPRSASYTSVTRCVVKDNRLDSQRRRLGR
jgi:hypothetical protein